MLHHNYILQNNLLQVSMRELAIVAELLLEDAKFSYLLTLGQNYKVYKYNSSVNLSGHTSWYKLIK
jgi:hypothetical protein